MDDNKESTAHVGAQVIDTNAVTECACNIAKRVTGQTGSIAGAVKSGLRGLLDNVQRSRVLLDSPDRWLAAVAIQRVLDGLEERGEKVGSWDWDRGEKMVKQGIDLLDRLRSKQ